MLRHMEDSKVIQEGQVSLTKRKSCLTSAGAFYGMVITSLDKGSDVIYLDFCIAFETVPQKYPSLNW